MGNETQVETMRAGLAITQEESIRDRAANHRDRKCRETRGHERRGLQNKRQNKTHKLRIMTATQFSTTTDLWSSSVCTTILK